jgi:hypothetical protein
MLIGEDALPFNSSEPRRITLSLSFVPKSNVTTIPPSVT